MKRNYKFIIVAIMLFSGTNTAFSQLKYNVQAGVNFASMTNNTLPNPSFKVGFRAGLGINYNFSEYFSVDPSLLLVSKGFKQSNLNTSTNPLYIQLPINATLNIPLSQDIKLLIGAGPYAAIGIGGKGSIDILSDAPLFSNNFISMTSYKNKFDAGVNATVGIMFRNIVLSAGGEWGFLPLNNMDYNGKKNYNNGFYITLTYRF
jgi:hypothetical protein